jgi:bifunctional non-homologous end joining protein LigD
MAAPDASPRGATNAAPRRTGIVPMMAALSALPADEDSYAFEVKWDGMRAIAHCEPEGLWLQTRTLRDITGGFPELAGLQNQLGARNAVVDGEIVAFDADGRPSFQRLQSRMHLADRAQVRLAAERAPAMYMIFDLLCLDGESLMAADYRHRRGELVGLNPAGPAWQVPATLQGAGADALAASRDAGLEGIIAKRFDSSYRPGHRGREWLKIKNVLRQEFAIGGFTAGEGRRKDRIGALLVGYHDNGRFVYAGKVGTGYTDADLAMLDRRLRPLVRKSSPFADARLPRGAVFVRPQLVGEFSFAEWTSQGRLRQPSFLGLREDKPAADVVRERVS